MDWHKWNLSFFAQDDINKIEPKNKVYAIKTKII